MISKRTIQALILVILLAVACSTTPAGPSPTNAPSGEEQGAETAPTPSTELNPEPQTGESIQNLVILYTSDEHGWMEGEEGQRAANMMGLWREEEGYTEDGPFLILSGGDMWTGPAISSWFEGESMADVMNAMGYDAAAIGNHEFDFGLEGLRERAAQSEFPFLSANIRDKESGEIASIAIPYVVQEVSGIQIGLIGLTTQSTPETTKPDHVESFDFISLKEALIQVVPQAQADGAEILIVVGHICPDEMVWLAPTAAELGIALIGGGHCHQIVTETVNNVTLVEAGAYLQGYVRVDIVFDRINRTVADVEARYHPNQDGTPDPEIAEIIAGWRALADETLTKVIGFLDEPIINKSNTMVNLVTNAWLEAYPAADVALTNTGGFRQTLPAGEVTIESIIGVLPFDNVLIDVELTGAELIRNIQCCRPVAGGMTTVGELILSDGTPIDPEITYHVLVNDFMYLGGDGFLFQEQDPDAYNTSIDWRQPVIDWIISRSTSPENPLDNYLDKENRQR